MQYICVNGYHDTTIWAIWTDVEIVVKTKPEGLIDVVTEKRYTSICAILLLLYTHLYQLV